jgi:hypothetical protein
VKPSTGPLMFLLRKSANVLPGRIGQLVKRSFLEILLREQTGAEFLRNLVNYEIIAYLMTLSSSALEPFFTLRRFEILAHHKEHCQDTGSF